MGREPKKESVHGYTWVNHLLYTWNKQINTLYNIVSHLYTNTKYKLQKENADSIPFQALVTWTAATSLKPGQAWVTWMDCLGAEGVGEDVTANEPCPMDLVSPFPSAPTHNLQILVGPPAVKLL